MWGVVIDFDDLFHNMETNFNNLKQIVLIELGGFWCYPIGVDYCFELVAHKGT